MTSGAKAVDENKAVIAAVNRCATQNQVRGRLFPQPAKSLQRSFKVFQSAREHCASAPFQAQGAGDPIAAPVGSRQRQVNLKMSFMVSRTSPPGCLTGEIFAWRETCRVQGGWGVSMKVGI